MAPEIATKHSIQRTISPGRGPSETGRRCDPCRTRAQLRCQPQHDFAAHGVRTMAITKPFRRNCRPFIGGGGYNTGFAAGNGMYVRHAGFATDAEQYIRAFLLLQKDIKELFEYVEPSDKNLDCHSYRVHALLMRLCIEVEANFRAIPNR
jgi:hypothetical protein